jgi:hypothetical protein
MQAREQLGMEDIVANRKKGNFLNAHNSTAVKTF